MIDSASGLLKTQDIKRYYDKSLGKGEEYIFKRWFSSTLRKEHYIQTHNSLSRELSKKRFSCIAEIGTGPCVWTRVLANRSDLIAALDLSVNMLLQARPFGDIKLCCADSGLLPLKNKCLDGIFSIRAFEYFSDKPRSIAEFSNALKPGGFLLILTKNKNYAGYGYGSHKENHEKNMVHSGNTSSDELVNLLVRQGFKDISVKPAIMGRSRWVFVWKAIRILRRIWHPAWKAGIPRKYSSFVESFFVTASKPNPS